MDVRMPDGAILRGIPDGTPKQEIMSKYNRSKLKKSNPALYDPASPEFKAKYGALSGMSDDDVFMAGAGKAVVDMGRGIRQLFAFGDRDKQLRAQQDEVNAQDAELMSSGNALAGNVTGNVATMLLPGAALGKAPGVVGKVGQAITNPQSIKAAAAVGAGVGALQPVGTGESRAQNALIGGLTSGATQGVVQGIGAVAQPVKNSLKPVDAAAVRRLEQAGVRLDAAQKTGSERLAQMKRFLTDNPVTASGQVRQAEQTAASYTRAVLKEIGANSDIADEATLGKAATRIGSEFDRIATQNPIKADNQLLNDLVGIAQGASGELESAQSAVISRQVDEVLAKVNNGQIDGKAYQGIKSVLDRISSGSNPQLGFWARELRGKLDDALQRSAKAGDHEALKLARKQYGALQGVIQAVKPDGNISPQKLYHATNVKSFGQKKAMATGKGQTKLQRLAKDGTRVIPERMPNSGTTPRALLQAALPAAAGGAYGFSQDGNWGDAAKFAALGVGAPLAAQQALNRPAIANYLARGVQAPAIRGLLQSPAAEPLMLRQMPAMGLLGLQPEEQELP